MIDLLALPCSIYTAPFLWLLRIFDRMWPNDSDRKQGPKDVSIFAVGIAPPLMKACPVCDCLWLDTDRIRSQLLLRLQREGYAPNHFLAEDANETSWLD